MKLKLDPKRGSPPPKSRIFFFIDYYPLPVGGMETHAYEFIRHYRSKAPGSSLVTIGFEEKSKGPRVAGDGTIVLPKSAITTPEMVASALRDQYITANDILFFNSLYWIEIFDALRTSFPDCFMALRSGGNDIMQAPILNKGKTLLERRSFVVETINRTIDFLIVNSNYTHERFIRMGIRPSIMKIIVGGVDTQRFKSLKNRRERLALRAKLGIEKDVLVLLCVCRLVPFKGIEHLLEALRGMKKLELVQLVLIGDGILMPRILDLVQEYDLADHVSMRGDVDPDKIHDYYRAADLYAQTPVRARVQVRGGSYIHTETMGRAFCEALSAGLPVIATRVGGIPEVVTHDKNGLLVAQRDVPAIKNALLELLGSKKKRERMSLAAKDTRDMVSWERIFGIYEREFKKMKKKKVAIR